MKTLSAQEVYDTAVGGVLRQGLPAVDHSGACVFRNAEGHRCAAGQFVPDGRYADDPDFPNWTVDHLLGRLREDGIFDLQDELVLIEDIQHAHDRSSEGWLAARKGRFTPDREPFIDAFRRRARFIALKHKLSDAILTPAPAATTA